VVMEYMVAENLWVECYVSGALDPPDRHVFARAIFSRASTYFSACLFPPLER
jgi:hypothetical protein